MAILSCKCVVSIQKNIYGLNKGYRPKFGFADVTGKDEQKPRKACSFGISGTVYNTVVPRAAIK